MNSLHFESFADELAYVESPSELVEALDYSGPITVLGEGTNVVLSPRIKGRVIRLTERDIEVQPNTDSSWLVVASAGVNWHELVRRTLGMGISGLENFALIPGSVGAAPIQNIGAYGVELSERLAFVDALDRQTHEFVRFKSEDCRFSYRNSLFKSQEPNRYVITRVGLILGQSSLELGYADVRKATATRNEQSLTAVQVAEEVVRIRRSKLPDPRLIGNVGSFFENPVISESQLCQIQKHSDISGFQVEDGYKIPAARLIDLKGWRNHCHGQAQVWNRQPLVLINRTNSNAAEMLELAELIREDIREHFGIGLKVEPTLL